jgi:steroid 5-alpha reductase family enzyme
VVERAAARREHRRRLLGPGFAIIAAVAFATGAGTDPRRFLVTTLVAMWGFRLGAYLFWRKRESPARTSAMRPCAACTATSSGS